MSVLEAMSFGLPVIATRVGAIPEVITDQKEGLLVEPGEVESLAQCLLRIDSSPALRRRMGRHARRRVATDYGLERMVERLCDIYRDSMGNAPGSSTR